MQISAFRSFVHWLDAWYFTFIFRKFSSAVFGLFFFSRLDVFFLLYIVGLNVFGVVGSQSQFMHTHFCFSSYIMSYKRLCIWRWIFNADEAAFHNLHTTYTSLILAHILYLNLAEHFLINVLTFGGIHTTRTRGWVNDLHLILNKGTTLHTRQPGMCADGKYGRSGKMENGKWEFNLSIQNYWWPFLEVKYTLLPFSWHFATQSLTTDSSLSYFCCRKWKWNWEENIVITEKVTKSNDKKNIYTQRRREENK